MHLIRNRTVTSETISTDGLVLHLDAHDPASYPGTGTAWYDLSGYGHNATLVGSPTHSTSPGRLAFSTTSRADTGDRLPEAGELYAIGSSRFTVQTWFRWATTPTVRGTSNHSHAILGRAGGIGGAGTFMLFCAINTYNNGNGAVSDRRCHATLRGTNTAIGTDRVDDNRWHQAVVTWDGNVARGYLDGQYKNTLNVGTAALQTVGVVLSGQSSGSTSTAHRFDGDIAVVTVYDRAITEDEVRRNYAALRRRYPA